VKLQEQMGVQVQARMVARVCGSGLGLELELERRFHVQKAESRQPVLKVELRQVTDS
jgi:hypothetical protein